MLQVLQLFSVALVGGTLFNFVQIPLPWMLGPVFAVIIWSGLTKKKLSWPSGLRNTGLVILGYILGSSFTVETGREILKHFPTMFLATLLLTIFSLLIGYFTHRKTGISLASGIIGSIPGGLSQMIVLSEEVDGADITIVSVMQTFRLLSAISIVPFVVVHGLADEVQTGIVSNTSLLDFASLQGGLPNLILFFGVALASVWVAIKINFPTPYLLGPILGTIILIFLGQDPLELPPLLVIFAQLLLGIYVGTRINLSSLKDFNNLLPYALGGSIVTLMFSFLIGFLLMQFYSISLIDSFLSTAPGGLAEMGLTAVLVKANLALVVAYQMFRLLFVLFVVPPIVKWLLIGVKKSA